MRRVQYSNLKERLTLITQHRDKSSDCSDTSSTEDVHVDVENNDDSAIGLWSSSPDQSSVNTDEKSFSSFSDTHSLSPTLSPTLSPELTLDDVDTLTGSFCSLVDRGDVNLINSLTDSNMDMKDLDLDLGTQSSDDLSASPYGISGELFSNGSHDCMMDIPLFQEVDSLMNIKHEDHLNDNVFYLPMSSSSNDLNLPSSTTTDVFTQSSAECRPVLSSDLSSLLSPTPAVVLMPSNGDTINSCAQSNAMLPTSLVTGGQTAMTGSNNSLIDALHSRMTQSTEPVAAQEAVFNGNLAVTPYNWVSQTDMSSKNFTLEDCEKPRRASLGSVGTSASPSSRVVCIRSEENEDEEVNIEDADVRTPEKAHSEGSDCGGDVDVSAWMADLKEAVARPTDTSITDESIINTFSSAKVEPSPEPPGAEASEALNVPELAGSIVDDSCEVDRFVICSDNTMECVLCSFSTESYSAFKSHIICSHPCWRITKKLSKNRLLVEKSVRSSLSLAGKGGGTGSTSLNKAYLSKDDSVIPSKPKKEKGLPRKKQLFERNKRLFKCTVCLRMFVFEGSVVNHVMVQHRAEQPYDYIHISNDHGLNFGPIYRCPQKNCFFSCESPGELERHNTQRHLQVIFRCQLCGYTADSADAVRSHGIHMHQKELTRFDSTTVM